MKAYLDISHSRTPFVHFAFPPQGDEEGFGVGGSASGQDLKTKADAVRILQDVLASIADGILPKFTLIDVINELELKQNDKLQTLIDYLTQAGKGEPDNLNLLIDALDRSTTQLEIDSLLEAIIEVADVLEDTPLYKE